MSLQYVFDFCGSDVVVAISVTKKILGMAVMRVIRPSVLDNFFVSFNVVNSSCRVIISDVSRLDVTFFVKEC